jgi:hypothetical protein
VHELRALKPGLLMLPTLPGPLATALPLAPRVPSRTRTSRRFMNNTYNNTHMTANLT